MNRTLSHLITSGRVQLVSMALIAFAYILTMACAVQATPPPDAAWNLTFDDEFNGTNLDLTKWDTIDICCINHDHDEYYLPQNCIVSNGILTEVFNNNGYDGYPYTSGAITSQYQQQYGYFEICCQLPPGDGMWPAFWALETTPGQTFDGNGWEIDIMEGLGSKPNWIDSNVGHWVNGSASWSGCQYGPPYPSIDFQSGYHIFGWEWRTNNDFLFYVDGVLYCEETVAEGASIPALSVCANLQGAIDGGPDGLTPNVDSSTPFPSYYNIDYIRIYQYGTVTNLPVTPTGVMATPGSGQVTLSWTASSGAASYNVKRSTVSGGPYITIASPTTPIYTDIEVTGGTTYYYVVSAVNSLGESVNSSEVSALPSPGSPATAIETFDEYVNGSIIGSGTMNGGTGWSGVWQCNHTGAQSVTNGVLCCTGVSLADWRNFASPVAIASNTSYYFRADLGLNESDQSGFWGCALTDNSGNHIAEMAMDHNYFTSFVNGSQFSGSAPGYTPNGTVEHLIGALQWSGSSLSLSVWVVSGSSSIPTSQSAAGSATWVQTRTDPTSSQIVGVLLESYGMSGNSVADNLYFGPSWASVISGVVSPPASPTNVTATVGDGQVTLGWSASSGAASYEVGRATVSGGPYTVIANPTTDSYTDTLVTNGMTYYYVVASVNGGGASANSSQVSATPRALVGSIISFNICDPKNSGENYLYPEDYAGAPGVRTNNWNNLVASSDGSTADISLAPGTVINCAGGIVNGIRVVFHPAGNGGGVVNYDGVGGTNDPKMVLDYNDVFNCTGYSQYGWIDFTNVPYANYEVYCYATSADDPGGTVTTNARGGFFLVTNAPGGAVRGYLRDLDNSGNVLVLPSTTGGNYFQSQTAAIPSAGTSWTNVNGGNYVVFSATLTNGWTRVWFGGLGAGGGSDDLGNTIVDGDTVVRLKVCGFQIVQVGPDNSPPGVPGNLSAAPGNGDVSLSWSASSGATSYEVERATVSGGPYTVMAIPTTNSYTDTFVTNGVTYYYVVAAVNGSGISANSSQVSAEPLYATTSLAFPSLMLSNAPVAYWRLNETNGAVAIDSAGRHNGTYGSAVTLGVPGPQPPAFLGFEVTNTAAQFFSGLTNSWVSIPALNLNTNTVTFMAWIYPIGGQADFSGLVFYRSGSTVSGMNYGPDGTSLGYTWNNTSESWSWNSGLQPPPNQWSLAAAVVQPGSTVLYLANTNGFQSATNNLSHPDQSFEATGTIGTDMDQPDGRVFNGVMDEVAVFSHALTGSQIQQLYEYGHQLPQVQIGLQTVSTGLNLTWLQGTLMETTNLSGRWSAVTNALSPLTLNPTNLDEYFKVLLH